MAKYRVTHVQQQTGVVDFGDMPEKLVPVVIERLAAYDDALECWSLGDVLRNEDWETVLIEVEKVG